MPTDLETVKTDSALDYDSVMASFRSTPKAEQDYASVMSSMQIEPPKQDTYDSVMASFNGTSAPAPVVSPPMEPEDARTLKLQEAQRLYEEAKTGNWITDQPTKMKMASMEVGADVDLGESVIKSMFSKDDTDLDRAQKYYSALNKISQESAPFITGPLWGHLLPDTVGFMAQMGTQYAHAWPEALAGGAVGFLAGPAGAVKGAQLGLNVGNFRRWYLQGVGSFYDDFTSSGVDKQTAKVAAMQGAVLYAASEFITGWIPGLNGLVEFEPIMQGAIKKRALSVAWNLLKSTGGEASEESVQQAIQDGFKNWAIDISNETKGTALESVTSSQMFQNAIQAFTQSFMPILLGGGIINAPKGVRAMTKPEISGQEQRGTQVSQTAPGAATASLSPQSQAFIESRETPEVENARVDAVKRDIAIANDPKADRNYQWMKTAEGQGDVIDIDPDTADVDDVRKQEAKAVRAMYEEITGKPVVFIQGETNPTGMFTNNALYLNIKNPTDSLYKVAGHETGHDIGAWAKKTPQHAATMREVATMFRSSSAWSTFEAKAKASGMRLGEEMDDETAAMFFSTILNDEKSMGEMLKANPTLFQRVWDLVTDFFKSVGQVASQALGLREPLDFTNPDIGAKGTQNLNSFNEESLKTVFGTQYQELRDKMLSVAKAYSADRNSTMMTREESKKFVAAVEESEDRLRKLQAMTPSQRKEYYAQQNPSAVPPTLGEQRKAAGPEAVKTEREAALKEDGGARLSPPLAPESRKALENKLRPIISAIRTPLVTGDVTKLGDRPLRMLNEFFFDKNPSKEAIDWMDQYGDRAPKKDLAYFKNYRGIRQSIQQLESRKATEAQRELARKERLAESKARQKAKEDARAGTTPEKSREMNYEKGSTVRVFTGERNVLLNYHGEDAHFWYGPGKIKYSKTEFNKAEELTNPHVMTIGGRSKSAPITSIPVSEAWTKGKWHFFRPSKTVGKYEAGNLYHVLTANWDVRDIAATPGVQSNEDKSWVNEQYADAEIIRRRAIHYTRGRMDPKLIDAFDAGAVQERITKLASRVAATDAGVMRNIPYAIQEARLAQLRDMATEMLDNTDPRAPSLLTQNEIKSGVEVKDLSEDSLRFRLAFAKTVASAIPRFIKQEFDRVSGSNANKPIEMFQEGEEPTLGIESELATRQQEEVRAKETAISAIEKKKPAAKPSGEYSRALDGIAAYAETIGSAIGTEVDPKTGLTDDQKFLSEVQKSNPEIYNTVKDALEKAREAEFRHNNPSAQSPAYKGSEARLSRGMPEGGYNEAQSNIEAQRWGFKNYQEVRDLPLNRAKEEANKLLKISISTGNYHQFWNVLTALHRGLEGESKDDPEGIKLYERMRKRSDKLTSQAAAITSAKRPEVRIVNGKKVTSGLREFMGLDFAVGDPRLELPLSALKSPQNPPGPNQIKLAQISARRQMDQVRNILTRKFEGQFGKGAKANDAISTALQSVWRDLGMTPIEAAQRVEPNNLLTFQTVRYQAKLRRLMDAYTATRADKWVEFWKSAGILSGIPTILQNPASNYIRRLYEYGPKQVIADTITGKNPFDSIAALFSTAKVNAEFARRAILYAKQSWETEERIIGGPGGTSKIEARSLHAIQGKWGRFVRGLGYRPLSAMDEYAKAMDIQTNLAMQYFHASRSGLDMKTGQPTKAHTPSGKEILDYTLWALENMDDSRVHDAVLRAEENTWQNPNPYAAPFATARAAIPHGLGHFLIPFANTPMNILTQSLRMTPLGILNMGKKTIRNAFARKNDPSVARYLDPKNTEFARDAAEQVIAAGVMWTLARLLWRDDDDDREWIPVITGARPAYRMEPGKGGFMQKEAMPPMHFRMGNKMIDYSRIEPLATILPAIITALETAKTVKRGEDKARSLAEAFATLGVAMTDKTFLGGLSDIVAAIENPDEAMRWASNFVASWMPNIVRSTVRAFDPYARDLTPTGDRYSAEWFVSLGKKTGYRLFPAPNLGKTMTPIPQYDYWGQPVSKSNAPTPSSDMLLRLLSVSGIKVKITQAQKLNMMIYNWNNRERYVGKRRPGDPPVLGSRYFGKPDRYIQVGTDATGKPINHYLTDSEYQEYIRTSGQIALERASRTRFNYIHPTYQDVNRLQAIMEMSRRIARSRIKRKLK